MSKKLINYLPDMLRNVREYCALFSALEPEIQLIQSEIDRAYENQFIKTADEEGISRFEKIYDIRRKANDTLESRCFRLLVRSVGMLPVTEKNFLRMMKIICGEDGFSYDADYENYFIKIRVALEKRESFLEASALCRNAIPANINLDLSLMYKQNKLVSAYTHSYLHGFTHREIKENI